MINEDPYEKGWIIKVTLRDIGELEDLMDEDEYTRYLQEELDS